MSDCICTIDDVEKICGGETNAGGLHPLLDITCEDEVTSIPAPAADTAEITGNIVMRSAAVGPPAVTAGRFRQWSFDLNGATYACEEDENGLYQTEVKVFVPKLKKGTTYTMGGIKGNNYIVLLKDMNQEGRRLIGDKVNGATVMVKETSSPKSGYEVTIKWTSAKAPYWYSGTVVN